MNTEVHQFSPEYREASPQQIEELQLATIGSLLLLKDAEGILSGKLPGDTAIVSKEYEYFKGQIITLNRVFTAMQRPREVYAMNGVPPYESPIVDEQTLDAILGVSRPEYPTSVNTAHSPENASRHVYIATVGRLNSGKSIPTNLLASEYGFITDSLSERIVELAAAYGHKMPHNRDVLHKVAKHVRNIYGPGALLRASIRRFAEPNNDKLFAFDGPRTKEEVEEFLRLRESGATVLLFSISTGLPPNSDQRERFLRAIGRNGPKDPKKDTPEEFRKFCLQDNTEGKEIDKSIALVDPDHQIINNGSIEEVRKQIRKELEKQGIYPLPKD